jgi:hypothetical protein
METLRLLVDYSFLVIQQSRLRLLNNLICFFPGQIKLGRQVQTANVALSAHDN